MNRRKSLLQLLGVSRDDKEEVDKRRVSVPSIEMSSVVAQGQEEDDDEDTESPTKPKTKPTTNGTTKASRKTKGKAKETPRKTSPIARKPRDKVPLKMRLDSQRPVASMENTNGMTRKITLRLERGPSVLDGHGYIYMYKLGHDSLKMCRKIGRTERLPERRVAEWSGGADLVKSWRCRRDRHAEVLIHWLCDRVRVRRYVFAVDEKNGKETLLTVNRHTKQYVQDAVYVSCVNKKTLPTLSSKGTVGGNRRVYKEWFMTDEKTLLFIIDHVVQDVNEHWKDEPWSLEMAQMK